METPAPHGGTTGPRFVLGLASIFGAVSTFVVKGWIPVTEGSALGALIVLVWLLEGHLLWRWFAAFLSLAGLLVSLRGVPDGPAKATAVLFAMALAALAAGIARAVAKAFLILPLFILVLVFVLAKDGCVQAHSGGPRAASPTTTVESAEGRGGKAPR